MILNIKVFCKGILCIMFLQEKICNTKKDINTRKENASLEEEGFFTGGMKEAVESRVN